MNFMQLLDDYMTSVYLMSQPWQDPKTWMDAHKELQTKRQALADYIDRLESMASRGDTSYSLHDQLIGGAR